MAAPENEIPLLAAAFRAMDATAAKWLVLRGDSATIRRGGDINILVEEGVIDVVDAVLHPLGFVRIPSAKKGHCFLLGYDVNARIWVSLNFVTSINFGSHQELATDTGRSLLLRRIRSGNRYRLSVDDAFWYLVLSQLLLRDDSRDEILSAAEKVKAVGPLAEMLDRFLSAGPSSKEIHRLIVARQWLAVERLRPTLITAWQHHAQGPNFARTASTAVEGITHVVRSAVHPSGLSVALIGPDGAGKTTLAEGIRTSLPIPSAYVYLGVWREYAWDGWLRYLPGTRLLMRIMRLLARSFQSRAYKVRGRIVLLDRFTYDAMLPSYGLNRRGRLTSLLVRRLCEQPDLVLVLDAPADVMYQRKGEKGVDELGRRRRAYLEVTRGLPYKVIIDATKSVEDVRHEAQLAIWQRLKVHWGASTWRALRS